MKNRPRRLLALASLLCLAPLASMAAGIDDPELTAADIQEMRRQVEVRYHDRNRQIDSGLRIERMTGTEAASARRFNEQEYRSRLEQLKDAELRILRSGKRAPAKGRARSAPPNSALPRIPSQSVMTYPGSGEPPVRENPASDGRQKNVGFGTREVEF